MDFSSNKDSHRTMATPTARALKVILGSSQNTLSEEVEHLGSGSVATSVMCETGSIIATKGKADLKAVMKIVNQPSSSNNSHSRIRCSSRCNLNSQLVEVHS